MHSSSENSLHILHYDIKDSKDLFMTTAIRLFGAWMLSLFSSLLVFNMFTDSIEGFIHVLLFFCVSSFTIVMGNIFVSSHLIHKWWTKISMIVWVMFLMIYQFALYGLWEYDGSIVVAALLLWLFTCFFWTAFHANMSTIKKNKKFGEKVALLNIIMTIVLALWPLVWWFILEHVGLWTTVIISSSFVFLSIIPLFLSHKKHKDRISSKENVSISIFKFLSTNRKNPIVVSFFAKGYIAFIGSVIRPIVIFIQFQSFTTVWIVLALTTVISVILLYLTGRLLNNHQENRLMKWTIGLQLLTRTSGIFVVVGSFFSGFILSIIDAFNKFTSSINKTCIQKSLYDDAGDPQVNLYEVILHEISIHLPMALLYGLFILLLSCFSISLWTALLILLGILIVVLPLQYSMFFRRIKK
jgi:hypothetical protein